MIIFFFTKPDEMIQMLFFLGPNGTISRMSSLWWERNFIIIVTKFSNKISCCLRLQSYLVSFY